MELSTSINAESSFLQKFLCLRVDVATLVSTLANGGSPDYFIVPEGLLDKIEDDEEKVCVLELHRDHLKLCLQEQQEQRRDDVKSRLEDKSSICAVGDANQNTTALP